MWKIHGKTYDLQKYIETGSHPGGNRILHLTQGLDDLSSLFETYHSFAENREKIEETLSKYQVDAPADITFEYQSYRELVKQVREILPNRSAIKADSRWVIQTIYTALLILFSSYVAFFSRLSFFIRAISAIINGCLTASVGFVILHDASHYAISKNPTTNEFLSKLTNSFVIWNPILWFYHHVYHHHSFTGIEKRDPDLYYYYPLMTKTENKRGIEFTLKNQDWLAPIILFIFPGLYTGQVISYFYAAWKYKYCIVPIPKRTYYDAVDTAIILFKLWALCSGGLGVYICYHLSTNFFYAINIIGDHDTLDAGVINHYHPTNNSRDWLKIQIHNSSNFVNENLLWTFLFGGINYQIEHHLFPSVSHIHYPAIAPIVKKYCEENNIPPMCIITHYGLCFYRIYNFFPTIN